jgi:hypothetical protein
MRDSWSSTVPAVTHSDGADEPAAATALPADAGGALARLSLDGAAILLLVLLAYAPALVNAYAFSDDWHLLDDAQTGGRFLEHVFAGGRPIYAHLLGVAFPFAGGVEGLAILRGISVAGIAALSFLLHAHLVHHGWPRRRALLVSVAACVLPPLTLFASWATTFPFAWAASLAGLASWAVQRANEGNRTAARAAGWALAALALAASFMVYQPAAGFFWVFAAVALLGRRLRAWVKLLLASTAVYGVAGAMGLAAARLGSARFPVLPPTRTSLTDDPAGKLRWFLDGPLRDALNLASLDHSERLSIACAAIVVGGLLLHAMRESLGVVRGALVPLALTFAAFAPGLIIRESWTSFRSGIALTPLVAILLAHAVKGLCATLRAPERALTAVYALAAAGSLLCATATLQAYMVRPQVVELAWLRQSLATEPAHVFVVQRWALSAAPRAYYDEFGLISLNQPWVPRSAVGVLSRAEGRPVPGVTFARVNGPPPAVPEGTRILDVAWLAVTR